MKLIYNYSNYRKYLADYYSYQKEQDSAFSYRIFGRKAGFSSPVFLKLIIDGKKNIGRDSIPKIAKALNLKKKESEYFAYLVFFNQAKDDIARNYYFGLIASYRTRFNVEKIGNEQLFEYYNEWHTAIVRELLRDQPSDINAAEIAQNVIPSILPKQVKKAIKTLQDLNYIIEENGVFKQSSTLIKTDKEVQSLALRNFHAKMIELAGKALREMPMNKRQVTALTAKISEKGYEKICERINAFRDELMQVIKDDENIDRVYQVNFQVFPVSKEGV